MNNKNINYIRLQTVEYTEKSQTAPPRINLCSKHHFHKPNSHLDEGVCRARAGHLREAEALHDGDLEGPRLGVEGQRELDLAHVGGHDEAERAVGRAAADALEVGPVQLQVDLLLALVLDQLGEGLKGLGQQVVAGQVLV